MHIEGNTCRVPCPPDHHAVACHCCRDGPGLHHPVSWICVSEKSPWPAETRLPRVIHLRRGAAQSARCDENTSWWWPVSGRCLVMSPSTCLCLVGRWRFWSGNHCPVEVAHPSISGARSGGILSTTGAHIHCPSVRPAEKAGGRRHVHASKVLQENSYCRSHQPWRRSAVWVRQVPWGTLCSGAQMRIVLPRSAILTIISVHLSETL